MDPATGDPQGYLPDGTVSKDYAALLSVAPKQLIYHGPARPPFFGSIRNTFSWKNISLSAGLAFRLGYYFHQPSVNYSTLFSTWNGNKDYAQRWQKPGDERITNVPSLVYPANPNRDAFYGGAQSLVAKADHIRLQDLTLSCELSKKNWTVLPLQQLRLYLYANNLGLLWTANQKGTDPESPLLPAARTIAIGINATF
ncbi:hypothetical protein [Solitalea lacus]|uniref:hypothetical protein n=1 Tax=Solitalea lacus TaxID=2911172 RepID=UPI001EDA73AA|nr:hypothetical protein [Solitalea lacus]UKJ07144.1 hypothetical protein L2B55_16640 [Solitalea lacus]